MANRAPSAQRVLLVDDDADYAELISVLFQTAGYEVAVAHCATSALETSRNFRPHLVLCDLELDAEMNGCDFAKAIRKDPQFHSLPLIAFSGHADLRYETESKEAGFDLYVTKPMGLEPIEALIERLRTLQITR